MPEACVNPCQLTPAGCRTRQARLRELLTQRAVDGALLATRSDVYYFTGYWPATYQAPLLLVTASGTATLIAPVDASCTPTAIDDLVSYEWHHLGTLLDDLEAPAWRAAEKLIVGMKSIACDVPFPPLLPTAARQIDIAADLRALRRSKDADEIALVQHAIQGCEAAYAQIAKIIRPGIREIDIYAEVQAAAVRALGAPIGELGNDFQAGSSGGPARLRPIEAGELMPLDVSVNYRGYRCDLCRTFVVGDEPTTAQEQAAKLVLEVLAWVEQEARAGIAAADLYLGAQRILENEAGWNFPHHLGHGIGLGVHEAPRLNPHWQDTLQVGDLFTVEPGLYGDNLRGGVRIEDNYWLQPAGLVKLSSFPRNLIASQPPAG